MNYEEKIKLFQDVFAPKAGEKILFLVDIPHDNINDNKKWKERREMAKEWFKIFTELGKESNFSVDMLEYKATGVHNSLIPKNILSAIETSNLFIAMTEYSASSSLLPLVKNKNIITRGASMPLVEKRMEETAFKADYKKVQQYASAIEKMLNKTIGAKVLFSTGDKLYIDLRNRNALSEAGDCTKPGQCINFPSGEACIAPYESAPDEVEKFGASKTEGIWPVTYDGELIKYIIKNNKIVEVIGNSKKANEMRSYFNENYTRANIAELGIGCNPKAVVTGNPLEDEKVGLHIAYGTSTHIGGKVKSDMHLDIIHVKGCPIEGIKLTLIDKDGSKIEIIQDSMLRYDLLR